MGPARLHGSRKGHWYGFLLCKRFLPKPYFSLCSCWFQRSLGLALGVVTSWLPASAPLPPSSCSYGHVASSCKFPLPRPLRPILPSLQEERSGSTSHLHLLLVPSIHGPAQTPQFSHVCNFYQLLPMQVSELPLHWVSSFLLYLACLTLVHPPREDSLTSSSD